MTFRDTDIDSLAVNLDALLLTSAERSALDALFDAAAANAEEVSGFAVERPAAADRYANHEVNYFRPRLITVLGRFIGETEKN